MLNDQDSNMAANAICHSASMVQEYWQSAACEFTRPAVLFKPKLSLDGNQWCALFGDDLQSGVCGFGDSPADAMWDFDKEWSKKDSEGEREMILTKDEVVKMARQVWPEVSAGAPMPDGLERFATLCRAPLVAEVERLTADLEQTRVQLAGCGVAAMQNTEESKANRVERGAYGWSASYGDVCRMVDREIELRAGVEVPELQELSSPHDERAVYGHSRDQLLAYGAAHRLAGQQRGTCTWTEQDDKDMPSTYESSCGEMWSFIDGGVKENRVTYCHHCGGKVVPASPELSRCAAADTNHDQATKRSRLE